ncbi:unnamed protein product [Mytilus coruscus]|uniref:PH domain-containing protein n=1 Tax=Mytilus coruscus TaxID=42192 RepID=A0A6J8AV23_MYTCO|nr:unnamed protein product [Mytilus coruscus]
MDKRAVLLFTKEGTALVESGSSCHERKNLYWVYSTESSRIKESFRKNLARLAPDKDDCTFRIITNSGAKHILRSTQLTDRQKWIDTILETQKRVNKDMGPVARKFRCKGGKYSVKEASSKEDIIDSSLKRSHSVGSVLGKLVNQTMTVFDEPEDTNTFSKQNCDLVAAIDFGSSDSGCAFSLCSDYKSNPLDIQTESLGGNGPETQKSPTVVLMNPDGEFAAFGKKAEQQYEELALDEEDKKWFYFRRFKMQLFTKKVLRQK